MIFSIIVRKKYLYGAFKIIFSPETFSTSLGHTGDNLERHFRRHLGGRGLKIFDKFKAISKEVDDKFRLAAKDKKASSSLSQWDRHIALASKRLSIRPPK